MESIIITGITGKSGEWFLKRLISESSKLYDYSFGFIIRKTSNIDLLNNFVLNKKVEVGSLDDELFLENVFNNEKYTTLLHIAGIDKSLKLVEAAVKHGIKRLILVHTTGIYSKYKSAGEEYRSIEQQIDKIIAGKDIALTILRPTMIYGSLSDRNIVKFIKMVDKLRFFPIVNNAQYELQPVHAKDLGNAYYDVLIHPNETRNKNYNLSGGAPIKLIDILKTIAKYLNKNNIFIPIPFTVAYGGACLVYGISFGRIDYREKVQRLVESRVYSHEEATKDFGYAPMSFQEGVKEEVEEYKRLRS